MTQNLTELKQKTIKLSKKNSLSSLIDGFLSDFKAPYFYFKYIPELCALKLMQSKPCRPQTLIRLYESEPDFKIEDLRSPLKIPSIARIADLAGGKMFPFVFSFKNRPFGFFLLNEKNLEIENLFQIFKLKCEALLWREQSEHLSGEKRLLKTLFCEIPRARSLKQPLNLAVIRCLHQEKIIQKSGLDKLSLFFKSLRNHIAKNAAPYDLIIQISPCELALVQPHLSETQTLEKAEKWSWVLESLDFEDIFSVKGPVLFQLGLAQYPKSARDAGDLLRTAREASVHKMRGGVCTARPMTHFKPDFFLDEAPR